MAEAAMILDNEVNYWLWYETNLPSRGFAEGSENRRFLE